MCGVECAEEKNIRDIQLKGEITYCKKDILHDWQSKFGFASIVDDQQA